MKSAPWAWGVALAVGIALGANVAHAALTFWDGGDGDWFDEDHWSIRVPTADDHAEFDAGGTATINGGYAEAANIAVDVGAVEQWGGICDAGAMTIAGYEGESASFTLGGEATLEVGSFVIAAAEYVTAQFTQHSGTTSVGTVTLGQYMPTSVATAEIISGSFSAKVIYLGNGGDGTFLHHDGTVEVTEFMRLGEFEDAQGRYELGALAELASRDEIIGNGGYGEMIHEGGLHTAESVVLGGKATGEGVYELGDGGTLQIEDLKVGDKGTGRFRQSNGETTIASSLYLAYGADSTGTVRLDGGSLACYSAVVGYSGLGELEHRAGIHTVEGELLLGAGTGSNGVYTLSGDAELQAGYLVVGSSGDGEFIQEGGSVSLADSLNLGWGGEVSRYAMSAGLLEAPWQYVGAWDAGRLEQSGGDNIVADTLYVGYEYGSMGEYELSGTATLTAADEMIGYIGTGVLRQFDGLHEVTGTLSLGALAWPEWDCISDGTLELWGGELTVGTLDIAPEGYGTLRFEEAMPITVRDTLRFGPLARLLAAPDAEIVLDGADLEIYSADADSLADLAALTLTATGSPCLLEVAGLRDGEDDTNFLMGLLAVGTMDAPGHVTLVDLVDNGRRDEGLDECLFLGQIEIDPDSSLDVNGLWLYVEGDVLAEVQSYIDDALIVDGTGRTLAARYDAEHDWTVVVPEPTSLALLLAGCACGMCFRGKRRT